MSRQVFCRKYQKEMDALDFAPFPGAKGQELFDSTMNHLQWIFYSWGAIDKMPNCTPLWFLPCIFICCIFFYFLNNQQSAFFTGFCSHMVKVRIDGHKDFSVGLVFQLGPGGNTGAGTVPSDEAYTVGVL